jgi:multidrug resistance efflux pump
MQTTSDQIAARNQQIAAQEQGLIAAQAQLVQAQTALHEAINIQPDILAAAKAQVAHDQWSLDQTTTIAPDGGYVTQVTLQPGTMVSVGPVMLFVNRRHNVLLKVTVMQNYVNVVKPGEEAEVAVPALPGKILHAKVVSVERITSTAQPLCNGQKWPTSRATIVYREDGGRLGIHGQAQHARTPAGQPVKIQVVETQERLPYVVL